MTQLALFDAQQSEAERIAGMDLAAGNSREALAHARKVARRLAPSRPDGITADDVVEAMTEEGFDMHCLGNTAGSLFSGSEWQWNKERRKSKRRHAHRNELKCWVLNEQQ